MAAGDEKGTTAVLAEWARLCRGAARCASWDCGWAEPATAGAKRERGVIGKLDFGTNLLTGLAHVLPLPVITSVGTINPLLGREISRGGGALCASYAKACVSMATSLELKI